MSKLVNQCEQFVIEARTLYEQGQLDASLLAHEKAAKRCSSLITLFTGVAKAKGMSPNIQKQLALLNTFLAECSTSIVKIKYENQELSIPELEAVFNQYSAQTRSAMQQATKLMEKVKSQPEHMKMLTLHDDIRIQWAANIWTIATSYTDYLIPTKLEAGKEFQAELDKAKQYYKEASKFYTAIQNKDKFITAIKYIKGFNLQFAQKFEYLADQFFDAATKEKEPLKKLKLLNDAKDIYQYGRIFFSDVKTQTHARLLLSICNLCMKQMEIIFLRNGSKEDIAEIHREIILYASQVDRTRVGLKLSANNVLEARSYLFKSHHVLFNHELHGNNNKAEHNSYGPETMKLASRFIDYYQAYAIDVLCKVKNSTLPLDNAEAIQFTQRYKSTDFSVLKKDDTVMESAPSALPLVSLKPVAMDTSDLTNTKKATQKQADLGSKSDETSAKASSSPSSAHGLFSPMNKPEISGSAAAAAKPYIDEDSSDESAPSSKKRKFKRLIRLCDIKTDTKSSSLASSSAEESTKAKSSSSHQSKAPHRLFRPVKKQKKFNESMVQITERSWYDSEHIKALLNHYIPHNDAIRVLDPMDAMQHDGQLLLNNLLEDQISQVLQESAGLDAVQSVIIPINLGGLHWVALHIHFNTNNRLRPSVNYIDPFGEPAPAVLLNAIKSVYSEVKGKEIFASPIVFQKDGYNCGPWVIKILECIAKNQALPPVDYNIGLRRISDMGIIRGIQGQEEAESSFSAVR